MLNKSYIHQDHNINCSYNFIYAGTDTDTDDLEFSATYYITEYVKIIDFQLDKLMNNIKSVELTH